MSNSSFPGLLDEKARVFSSFSRGDIVALGGGYLFLSLIKASIFTTMGLLIGGYLIKALLFSKLPKGFFKEFVKPRTLAWRQDMVRVYVKR